MLFPLAIRGLTLRARSKQQAGPSQLQRLHGVAQRNDLPQVTPGGIVLQPAHGPLHHLPQRQQLLSLLREHPAIGARKLRLAIAQPEQAAGERLQCVTNNVVGKLHATVHVHESPQIANDQPVDSSIQHPSVVSRKFLPKMTPPEAGGHSAAAPRQPAFWSLAVAIAALLTTFGAWAADAVLMADSVVLNAPGPGTANLTRVNFRRTYPSPPLVFVLTDAGNPDPASLRVTNITTTGFDIGQFEPPGENGNHPALQFDYLAISPGNYNLGGGVRLEAGRFTSTAFQGRLVAGNSWQTLNFVNNFANPAALLLAVQGSANGLLTPGTPPSPWLTVTARNVTGSSAEVALERSETSTGNLTNSETIAYLAMSGGTSRTFPVGGGNFVTLEALQSATTINGWDDGCATVGFAGTYADPLAFATKATRNGGDGGWLRRCALSGSAIALTVDEDRSNDSERSHTAESAGVLVFSREFDDDLAGGNSWEAAHASIGAVSGGSLSFTQVTFPETFATTPLVFSQATETGPAPATVRIRAVTPSGFQIAAVEPPGSSGAHPSMTLAYVAAIPGRFRFQDGTNFEAGFVDTTTVQAAPGVGGPTGWNALSFLQPFTAAPALIAQLQTTANSDPGADPSVPFIPWLTVAVDNLSGNGVSVALERSEAAAGAINTPERIAYLAMTADRHGTLTDSDNAALAYDSRRAVAAAQGYDDGCFDVAFTAPFAGAPLAISHGTSRNGNNGGWLRRCGVTAATIRVHVDEDVSADAERSHIAEDVGSLAFARPFVWRPFPDLEITSSVQVVDDPTGGPDPKAIPGAVLEYQLLITNTGRGSGDSDSIIVVDAIPADAELFVGDLDGAGNPVMFEDGVAPDGSGLTFDAASDLSFSDDGGTTFNYVPGAVVYDPAITHLRINPAGIFTAATGAANPNFIIRYRVRVR